MPMATAGIAGSAMDVSSHGAGSSVFISVREPNGLPVTGNATVKLSCPLANVTASSPTNGSAQTEFTNVPPGDCFVEVSAPGYKTSRERTVVAQTMASIHQYVYVYLHSASEVVSNNSRAPVSLDVLKEMDKGTEALHNNRADDARKHWLKAAERAPENPDVQYLLGTLESSQNNVAAAKSRFERAITLSPTHEHALLALGELQLRDNQATEATATLKRALQVNTMSYRAEFYIAQAYLQQQDYANARAHAQRAVELGGNKQPMAHALLGQALAADGNRDAARHEFETLIHDHPDDPAAAVAKEGLANLEKSSTATLAVHTNLPVSTAVEKLPPIEALPETSWAPADVDNSQPGVATDVACPEADIVQRTGQASTEQLENFEKFTASEHIEHEEIDRNGSPSHLKTHDFSYLVFIDRDKSGQIFLKESRDGGSGVSSFPTSLATVGLLGLGASIFHPGFAAALDFKCEGLGQRGGKAVWVMHFRQKANQRSYLRLWQTQRKTVEIPLKGRVWVAASTYEVVHVETDLREPVPDLELKRDHLVIDYGPVSFHNGKTELWLPWHAEMYLELHRRRYHHRHTLSNYSLFAVDTTDKINNPKGVDIAPDQQ
jgi:tetratricopeptide (TPR) repeat protein